MSPRVWAMLFALGLLWGGSFFFSAVAVREIPPLALVLFRVGLAAGALPLYLAARGPAIRAALPRSVINK
jgi:drug/metabolite transporter (DMT)-like permease